MSVLQQEKKQADWQCTATGGGQASQCYSMFQRKLSLINYSFETETFKTLVYVDPGNQHKFADNVPKQNFPHYQVSTLSFT